MKDQFNRHHEVPDAYFEQLEMQLQEKLGQKKSPRPSLMFFLKLGLPIAAILLITYLFLPKTGDTEIIQDSISNEEIEAYLLSELSTDELMGEYASYYYSDNSSDEYEDYMLDRSTDLSDIEELY